MEIQKNNNWNELCTPTWNEDENILTCMAMGYFENSFYERYNDHNTSNATIRRTCSSLTNCMNTNKKKPQLCKGICPIKIVSFITLTLQKLIFQASKKIKSFFHNPYSAKTDMSGKQEDTNTQACANPNCACSAKIITLQTYSVNQ